MKWRHSKSNFKIKPVKLTIDDGNEQIIYAIMKWENQIIFWNKQTELKWIHPIAERFYKPGNKTS
jgi:hypothetical protein